MGISFKKGKLAYLQSCYCSDGTCDFCWAGVFNVRTRSHKERHVFYLQSAKLYGELIIDG